MTKIEIIEKKIEKDQITLKKLRDKEHEIEKARIEKWTEMYNRYFKDAIMEGDTLEVSNSYVYFKRFKEDYNYHKEIISLNVRVKSWRDDEADSIETSFYSTNDNSDYELKRMITIGRVGMVVLDFKDDIIAEYNSIRNSFKDKLSKARKDVSHLNHEISKLSTEISRIKDQEVLDRLSNDGVEFEVDKENLYKLPSLSVRWNWAKQKQKENPKETIGKPEETQWKTIRKPENNHRKTIGQPLESYKKTTEKPKET